MGRSRKNWPETIREDLRGFGLTWEDALDAVEDRDGWRKALPDVQICTGKAKI